MTLCALQQMVDDDFEQGCLMSAWPFAWPQPLASRSERRTNSTTTTPSAKDAELRECIAGVHCCIEEALRTATILSGQFTCSQQINATVSSKRCRPPHSAPALKEHPLATQWRRIQELLCRLQLCYDGGGGWSPCTGIHICWPDLCFDAQWVAHAITVGGGLIDDSSPPSCFQMHLHSSLFGLCVNPFRSFCLDAAGVPHSGRWWMMAAAKSCCPRRPSGKRRARRGTLSCLNGRR